MKSKNRNFKNIRKSGIIAINLDEGDELSWVWLTDGNDDIIVATRLGMSIRFNENDCRPIGRTARGVKAIELKEDDEVIGMCVIGENETDEKKVLTVAETGLGRLSEHNEYRLQSRAGKGVLNYHTEKYGKVASVALVSPEDDIIMISSDGILIRIPASQINIVSRTSKGVRVMRLAEGERVVSAIAVREAYDNALERLGIIEAMDNETYTPEMLKSLTLTQEDFDIALDKFKKKNGITPSKFRTKGAN